MMYDFYNRLNPCIRTVIFVYCI